MKRKIIRVSIVEDRPDIRKNLEEHINQTDDLFCISSYADGESALKGLLEDKPDVVIMDIGIPKMNGIECMLRVKLKDPEIIFLMYTIFEEDEKVFDALKSGASGYILKDERASGAIKAIREVIKYGCRPMSPVIAQKAIDNYHVFERRKELIEKLSEKQFIVLKKLSEGKLNKEIANELNTTEATIRVCVHRVFRILHVNNRVEATLKYLGITKI